MGYMISGLDLLAGLAVLLLLVYYYLTATYSFWKDRGVPYCKPEILFGNTRKPMLQQISMMDNHVNIYNQFKKERFVGYFLFRKPILMIRDPALIERITKKDFNYFEDRELPIDPDAEPLLINNLFSTRGQKWRHLRNKLTPTFTSGKLKGMFDQIYNCGDDLLQILETYSDSGKEINVGDIIMFFTTDVIASCAFGLQIKADSPETKVFRKMARKIFTADIKQYIRVLFPGLAKLLGVKVLGKEANDYFLNVPKETIQYREKNGIQRNDFVQLLMNLKQEEENENVETTETQTTEHDSLLSQLQYSVKDKTQISQEKLFTDESIAGQSLVFLVGGSDTVAGTLSFAFYEIAKDPEVQRRMQEEIDQAFSSKGCCYESIKKLTYMDQVIQETLRLHPSVFVHRICSKPYQLPGTDVILDEGQVVVIPNQAIHRDPEYYPDPQVFDPERFQGNNYQPSPTYLPFGDGPRICIGMRFALLKMKICLSRVLYSYSISANNKTLEPIKYSPGSVSQSAYGGIWLNVKKRSSKKCS